MLLSHVVNDLCVMFNTLQTCCDSRMVTWGPYWANLCPHWVPEPTMDERSCKYSDDLLCSRFSCQLGIKKCRQTKFQEVYTGFHFLWPTCVTSLIVTAIWFLHLQFVFYTAASSQYSASYTHAWNLLFRYIQFFGNFANMVWSPLTFIYLNSNGLQNY